MRLVYIAAATLALASCDGPQAPDNMSAVQEAPTANAPASQARAKPIPENTTASDWKLESGGEGVTLALVRADRSTAIRIACPSGQARLLVNVPGFRPIGSEERLSFGSGGNVVTLVADSRGDEQRGGVTGSGEVPNNLPALLGANVTASYGAQTSAPNPAPAPAAVAALVASCARRASAESPPSAPGPSSACNTQEKEQLNIAELRAVGTEPFWGARIQGRCVTYSHPDDQQGTRVWTHYTATKDGGTWAGMLNGKPFLLQSHVKPGCSDGMSDKTYPIIVMLKVNGEERSGCAESL